MPRHLSRRTFLAASTTALSGCWKKPKPGFAGFAFVANEEGPAIAAVDLMAFAVVRHIRLDSAPTELISHPQRQAVYALTPLTGTVHEISRSKLARTRWTALGGPALDMRLATRRNSIWILLREPKQLVELNLDTFEVRRRIALPQPPYSFDLAFDQTQAIVSFGANGTAGLVNLDRGAVSVIECGAAIGAALFRKDGLQWMAAHSQTKMLTMMDTESGKVVVRLPLAMRPQNLCFKHDMGQLFITGEGSDAVAIVFPFQTQVEQTVLAGHSPAAMAASPLSDDSPEFLFVTNPQSGQVTIVNIDTRKVVAVAQVGAQPSHVAITPNNQYALVLNQKSGDMAVILIQSTARVTKSPAALFTMIPVGSKPVSAVVQAV